MNKILVGLIVGAVLGAIDGATAWFTPAVRDQMMSIVIWSTLKGVIAGIAAGWYARRVQSVPKGIVFGFVVGLILAFAVAATTPGHYWWQIMVPGSVLGGVMGWATQRYGRPASRRGTAAAMAMIAMSVLSLSAFAGEGHDHGKPALSANAAFDKLKALAGKHNPNQLTADGQKTIVEYKIAANGSAVFETMFAGEPHEMITVYTVDGPSVVATHYCSGGNQPVMRLNTAKSSTDSLVFDFEKITGNVTASHITGVTFQFSADGKLEEVWSTKSGEHMRLFYTGLQN